MLVINSFSEQRKLMLHLGCRPNKTGLVKANGLAGLAKRISKRGRIQSYEGRMRVFEFGGYRRRAYCPDDFDRVLIQCLDGL